MFAELFEALEKNISVNKKHLPFYSSSLADIARNMIYIKKSNADIFHVTGDVHYAVLALPSKKTILTVHDTVFIRNSKGVKQVLFKWLFLKLPVKSCRFVTTISEKSKNEIIQYTGCNPGKVIVIPNPVGKHIYWREKIFNAQDPVLLFIGSTSNKNLPRIIEAITGITCTLEIVGLIPEDHLLQLKKNSIRFKQYQQLSEIEMADRYASCDIVVFPSLYEGFGLPVIEAQKAGRAVITSNISPMLEVAGDGACLVDPYDVQSIRTGIRKILEDSSFREIIVKKGFENIKQYDPQKIADEYLKLYRKILD